MPQESVIDISISSCCYLIAGTYFRPRFPEELSSFKTQAWSGIQLYYLLFNKAKGRQNLCDTYRKRHQARSFFVPFNYVAARVKYCICLTHVKLSKGLLRICSGLKKMMLFGYPIFYRSDKQDDVFHFYEAMFKI